jgi:exosortase/archaeosortase family protein
LLTFNLFGLTVGDRVYGYEIASASSSLDLLPSGAAFISDTLPPGALTIIVPSPEPESCFVVLGLLVGTSLLWHRQRRPAPRVRSMISRSHQPLPNGLLVSPGHYGSQWWSKHAGAIGTLQVVWFACLKHLSIEWNHNPEYHPGWIMPIAVAVLLFLRRHQRPFNPIVDHAMTRQRNVWAALLLLAAWFPVRVIAQANPDWHLIGWVTFFFALSLTCILVHALGGNEAVRLYAAPFIIIAAAIPFPFFFEYRLIAFLKELTATCSLEILHLGGIAVFREAQDLIALKHTVLGIEDGCTGIRSLHLCLAAALFWGELHRLNLRTRTCLVLGAACWAVGVNVIRSVSLARLAETGGPEKFHRYHEAVGLTAQALTLYLIALALDLLLRPKEISSPPELSRIAHFLSKLPGGKPVRVPSWIFSCLVISVIVVEGGRMAWFKWHAAEARKTLWSFHTPRTIDDLREVAFPRKWGKSLSPDDIFSAEWKEDDHTRALYYLFWSSKPPFHYRKRTSPGVLPHRFRISNAGRAPDTQVRDRRVRAALPPISPHQSRPGRPHLLRRLDS